MAVSIFRLALVVLLAVLSLCSRAPPGEFTLPWGGWGEKGEGSEEKGGGLKLAKGDGVLKTVGECFLLVAPLPSFQSPPQAQGPSVATQARGRTKTGG